MKNLSYLFVAATAAICASLCSCESSNEYFDNKAFISTDAVSTILLDGKTDDAKTIVAQIAKPVDKEVKLAFNADASKLNTYNMAYYDKAVILPSQNYSLSTNSAVINAGSIKSTDVTVSFSNLDELDREVTYVLPITASTSDIEMLESKTTSYYVIRGAALVNVVANIDENYLTLVNPSAATGLGNMSQVTVECLARFTEFGKLISTVMGIEGNFLIRIGDAGLPDNQIQLATSSGNVTDTAWQLDTGKWTHIAVTFDSSTGAVDVYFNGVHKGSTQYSSYRRSVNWNSGSFYVGKSYDNNRWFDGEISEARVWNRVLSADEINAKNHFYMVDASSDGLVAYWKFNEGSGNVITDVTSGYNLVANSAITWKPVSLPE
ncbi:MAG: DUF1735 and LamG domain-containing protein [Muribaculaceae bacterium]